MSGTAPGYQIGRPTGVCAATGQALTPGANCVTALCEREGDDGLERLDFAESSWEAGPRPPRLLAYWKGRVPEPHGRQRLLVDDEVLLNLFERLAGDDRSQRVAFRFVLALILMRKRLLKYMGREGEGAGERWLMMLRGSPDGAPPIDVINPHLGDEDVRQVTEQLGEILQSEF